jgi:hypothetical protein
MYCYFFCIFVPGKEMNALINQNWSELFKELYPTLSSVLNQIILTVFSGFDKLVPFDEIFPEKLPK